MNIPSLLRSLCIVTSLLSVLCEAQQPARRPPNPALAQIQDTPGLPRVLLIGDSISMGYTLPVREMLAGKANVHRIPVNGGPTINGVTNMEKWLAAGKWDVIHFNFGLHDLKQDEQGARQVPVAQYEKNLRQLVEQMKKTGAKLIFATTTPVPEGKLSPMRTDEDVKAYNAAARRVMEEQGVAIDDLYAFALPQLARIQRPVNVHFSDDGSRVLAKQVVESITAALPNK